MFIDAEKRPAGEPSPSRERGLPTEITKLSTAIRIGALIRPQCKVRMFYEGNSCAIGAAVEGAGLYERAMEYQRLGGDPYHLFEEAFPGAEHLMKSIYRMNDAGETREAIADWLESQGY